MASLNNEKWKKINETILGIYSEPDIYKMRLNFLKNIEDLIPYKKSFFDLANKKKTKVVFFDPITETINGEYINLYYNEYQSIDTMLWFFSQNKSDIYRESDYITSAMKSVSLFYNQWMKPQNIEYSMGSKVTKNDILYGSVNLWRGKEKGDFTDEEMEILRILNNHLALYFYNKYPNGIKRNNENDYSDTLIHIYDLTGKESQIVELIYKGLSNKQIAEEHFISENTVKKHIYNIYKKMQVNSRMQLIRAVQRMSITTAENLTEEPDKNMDQIND